MNEEAPILRNRRQLLISAMNAAIAVQLSGCGGGGASGEIAQAPQPAPNPPPAPSPNPAPSAGLAPIADAGAAQFVVAPTIVQLDGSLSHSATGSIPSAYEWRFSDKPLGSISSLSTPTGARPTFKADEPGSYAIQLVVSDGSQFSTPSSVSITAAMGRWSESTIVFRVVGTSPPPGWGQEPVPGWPAACPVKNAANYQLYDVEIARDSAGNPVELSVFMFQNWEPNRIWTASEFAAYRSASTLFTRRLNGSSSDLLTALKASIDKVMVGNSPSRFIVEYSGHGGPATFFEGALSMTDARAFVQHVRAVTGDAALVLDFSTNCDVGFVDFIINLFDTADYLIASDLSVGGFDPGNVTNWLSVQHDNNLHTFFETINSNVTAIREAGAARQAVWNNAQSSITSLKVQQSLSAFSLSEFLPLMRALKKLVAFDPVIDIPSNSWNLATYVYSTGSLELIGLLERFRFFYASNRNLFSWSSNELGLGVSNSQRLRDFLQLQP